LAEVEEYTWEEYDLLDRATLVPLTGLGAYNIPVGDLDNGYEPSDFATAGDIAQLIQTRDASSNLVAFVLQAMEGERDWGDIEYQNTPPRLVINEAPTVPGDFDKNGS